MAANIPKHPHGATEHTQKFKTVYQIQNVENKKTSDIFFNVMDSQILIDIIILCLSLDKKALETYLQFSLQANNNELKTFWKIMAADEKMHVAFWEKLLDSTKQGVIPQVFNKPLKIKEELEDIVSKSNMLLNNSSKLKRSSDIFLLAYRLEYYLLHPAFETLFQFMQIVSNKPTPANTYGVHLDKFLDALKKHGEATPELELLAETIGKLWERNKALTVQSSTDSLTNLLNRRGFQNSIKSLSHLAQRNKNNVGIMMMDIDCFKKINDKFGHLSGDAVIKSVANIIKNQVRESDVSGRFGGEEFIVFLSAIAPESLKDLAEKICSCVEKETMQNIPVTISIGASQKIISTEVEKEVEALIKKADECLHQAKEAGKNKVVLYH